MYFGLFHERSSAHEAEPCFGSRVTESPLDGGENMAFHLNEGGLFISVTADLSKVLHSRDTLLGILEFGSDPEGSTANKLIVLDVDNPTGDVAVNDVEGEIQGLWA